MKYDSIGRFEAPLGRSIEYAVMEAQKHCNVHNFAMDDAVLMKFNGIPLIITDAVDPEVYVQQYHDICKHMSDSHKMIMKETAKEIKKSVYKFI